MDGTTQETVYVPPAVAAEEAGVVGEAEVGALAAPQPPRFDLPKALRYSVATYGAANFYVLFISGMPLYLSTYKLDPALIGLLANERSFVGALVQPFIGRLSDRTRTPLGRRRPFFLVGIPLTCLALLLLAFHPSFWLMLGIMTVAAFFLAVAVDPYLALMADLFPLEQRGRVGGFTGLANALGAITFSLLAFMLWSTQEFAVFLLVIVLLIVSWAFTFFTVREPPLPADAERPATRSNPLAYLKDLWQYNEAAKYTLAMTLFWVGNGGATPYVTLFGKYALGANDSDTFLLPLMYIAVTALAAVPAGILADRIGKKRVITLGLLIYGLGGILGSQSPNMYVAAAALAVIGLGNACTSILVAMLTDMVPRPRTAELVGIFSAATSFAQPLGAALAGLVVDVVSHLAGAATGYRWSFIFAGTMILLGAALLQTVHPQRAKYAESAADS